MELRLEVGAPLWAARGRAPPPPAPPAPEEPAEQVTEAGPLVELERSGTRRTRGPPPPYPPAPMPEATISRTWSYSLRFSESPSTSYADETCLKRSSASAFPGLASGWCSFANFR